MSQTQAMEHADSIRSQDPHNQEEEKKTKSRRPANTAFRQQRLKAWQPILTPKTVLPLFFIVGIIFAPIGGLLIWASSQVEEISIDYSDCHKLEANGTAEDIPGSKVDSYFKKSNYTGGIAPTWQRNESFELVDSGARIWTNTCTLMFDIPNDIGPPVLFYYRLTNFYQNHRRYVKSVDPDQMMGKHRSNDSIRSSDCDPLRVDDESGKAYYPCGLIANSMFNDTFGPTLVKQNDDESYTMINKGIAWDSDRELFKKTEYTIHDVVPPPNWRDRYPGGVYSEEHPIPNLHENEPFQVWMRTAGLPTFSKLAMRNNSHSMTAGRYRLVIRDYFPVTEYGGTKSIFISTRTVMGGKNPSLGIAYVVVGGFCVLMGAVFTATHLIKPRKLGDHTYLTWNTDQPTTATTTGRAARPGEA
ncbi:Lem3/Cdc50 [Patellaria atrata CBS 101060]|uniref:Lem3/Cdc50 n=1 Tax=Patellaria atrata CBS 101060 TaxID=1346257 RepID=A0A9P4S6L3_9PEZI|nr:Lem3/Cdc50 [Patellaria atrata CBS 101060]